MQRISIGVLALFATLSACGKSKFVASGSAPAPAPTPVVASSSGPKTESQPTNFPAVQPEKGNAGTLGDNKSNGIDKISGAGGSANDGITSDQACVGNTSVADPNATKTFAQGEARTLINSLTPKYIHIPTEFYGAGDVHYDPVTAAKICALGGYSKVVSMVEGKYHSPGDNYIFTWEESMKNFTQKGAKTSNSLLEGLVCNGLLTEPCRNDKSWIFK